ncbi:MAG TPA: hypothetical protein VGI57_05465 [Usitatibacter sp.]|jgi:hypothetical protein
MALDDPQRQVHRKLDQVVGKSFDEDGGRRWRKVVKWIVAAACAVGTAALVVYGIESHRLPPAAQMPPPPPPKPVTVQIIPAKPP